MFVLGLTGSIGMGKTTVASMFRRLKVPVFDADRSARALLAPGGRALATVAQMFPEVVRKGLVDRDLLAKRVFGCGRALDRLETVLHPMVDAETEQFVRCCMRWRCRLMVLDVPLLFESGQDRRCDAVAVVSAPYRVQIERLRARPGMTEDRIAAVLARQMSDEEKRRRADFVIPTGQGRAFTFQMVRRIADMVGHGAAKATRRQLRARPRTLVASSCSWRWSSHA